ncbi:MAG TPA: hypothetical protein VHK69_10810 [Chitinophagaceae bacterium]|jgi:hypothetical protein|nr:hypothetical protein [Chitinophagaceae bacterium]
MRYCLIACLSLLLLSCFDLGRYRDEFPREKVLGYRPVYLTAGDARQVFFTAQKQPVKQPGNIYAYGRLIFQVEVGRGIHVIDNTDPARADRIGFITVNGCSQISVKGKYLYTNALEDLVTIDISDTAHLEEVSRIPNALPDFRYHYPLSQPEESGYYICPRYDSVVVGWIKDSIIATCQKN